MALRNVVKILSRRFSTGAVTKNGGGIETKHTLIRDDRLRSLCVRLDQVAEEANQLRDECNALYTLKRAFPRDQLVWLLFIFSLSLNITHHVAIIRRIKGEEAQSSARLAKRQELQLSA